MVDKKNVLIVISSLTGGGAEYVAANLCRHVDNNLFNVAVCHLKEKGERGASLAEEGYDVVGIAGEQPGRTRYLSFLKLRQLIQQKKIDIIHSHSIDALIDCSLCRLTMGNVKHLHTFHYGNYPNPSRKYHFMEKLFQSVPDKLIAVGIEQRKTIQKTFGIPDHRITTIWNGVENTKSQYDQVLMQQYNSNGKVLIGSISTFIEQKGLFQLLEVMSELKKRRDDFICVIVGDGPLRPQLEERHRKLDLGDSVRFMGWIKNASITVLPALDIFVQSSLWEAMSIVVLEAMGAGKAIIVTDVGDNKHVVDNGKNGILVEKKDVAGMVEKLEQLIIDERLRKKLGQQAQEKVNRECTVTQTARNHEKLYREILEAVR